MVIPRIGARLVSARPTAATGSNTHTHTHTELCGGGELCKCLQTTEDKLDQVSNLVEPS